jgi:hypothetical protein
MLKRFEISDKVLAVAADNATPNDKQIEILASLPNSFEEVNHVRCFNHSLQLSAKTLIAPFNVGICSKKGSHDEDTDDPMPELCPIDEDDDEDDEMDGDGEDAQGEDGDDADDADDNLDELAMMDETEREQVMADTAAVRQAVSKVCHLSYSHALILTNIFIASTTIIRNHSLNDHCSPRMAPIMRVPQT